MSWPLSFFLSACAVAAAAGVFACASCAKSISDNGAKVSTACAASPTCRMPQYGVISR